MNDKGSITKFQLYTLVGVFVFLLLIFVPLLLRAKVKKNEAVALETVKTILEGEKQYFQLTSSKDYAIIEELTNADGLSADALIDPKIGSGKKQGYTFRVKVIPPRARLELPSFELEAWPLLYKRTGVLSFYADESGVIRAGKVQGCPGNIQLPILEKYE